MNKEDFVRILQATIMLYEGNQPYFIQKNLNLSQDEMRKVIFLFKELRFEPELKKEIKNA